MKRTHIFLAAGLACAFLIAFVLLERRGSSQGLGAAASQGDRKTNAAGAEAPYAHAASAGRSSEETVQDAGSEVAPPAPPSPEVAAHVDATRRSFAAHSPLRAQAVADPNSKENMRILSAMAAKALAASVADTGVRPKAGSSDTSPESDQ